MGTHFVAVLSGGQDSTTSLYWAKNLLRGDAYAITFDYGQRHRVEIEAAKLIAERAEVEEHIIVPVSSLCFLGGSALVSEVEEIRETEGLPTSFVPGRNILFLTLAAAWAYQKGISDLVTGVCQTDYSGYPDCRSETVDAVETALSRGLDASVRIHTPLMHLTKCESVKLASSLPDCMDALALSHTCYEGRRPACGRCPACRIRLRGFQDAGINDPLDYETI